MFFHIIPSTRAIPHTVVLPSSHILSHQPIPYSHIPYHQHIPCPIFPYTTPLTYPISHTESGRHLYARPGACYCCNAVLLWKGGDEYGMYAKHCCSPDQKKAVEVGSDAYVSRSVQRIAHWCARNRGKTIFTITTTAESVSNYLMAKKIFRQVWEDTVGHHRQALAP